jgi:hypothetical protein
MNSSMKSNISSRPRVKTAGALLMLAAVSIALASPAAARKGGGGNAGAQFRASTTSLTPLPPVVRDHRGGGAVIRDARTGTVTRDHRGGKAVTSMPGTKKRGVPCLGNLCNVKICTASFCF